MNKISMLLPVYNEGHILRHSLENTMRYVHEAIVVDGSPWGPSTDETPDIIGEFDLLYPGKITYLTGTFALENGAWDESAQRNLGLSKVTGNILMPHCGDMVYTNDGMARMVAAVDKFREQKIFYCLFLEFWIDQTRLRLYMERVMNEWFPLPAVSDIPMMSMDVVEHYHDGPNLRLKPRDDTHYLYVPQAYRYHYGWITGFAAQVKKHIRNMSMGAWKKAGEPIVESGEAGIAKWAINHVINYKVMGSHPFSGDLPINANYNYLEGYDKTIAGYESKHGKDFWKEE